MRVNPKELNRAIHKLEGLELEVRGWVSSIDRLERSLQYAKKEADSLIQGIREGIGMIYHSLEVKDE